MSGKMVGRALFSLGAAVGFGCLATIVLLIIVGASLCLGDSGMDKAATILLPLCVLVLLPIFWRYSL